MSDRHGRITEGLTWEESPRQQILLPFMGVGYYHQTKGFGEFLRHVALLGEALFMFCD